MGCHCFLQQRGQLGGKTAAQSFEKSYFFGFSLPDCLLTRKWKLRLGYHPMIVLVPFDFIRPQPAA
jgi:hypothetical protein